MKSVLIVKMESGDYIAIPRNLPDVSTLSVAEMLGASIIKSYSMERDIRVMLDEPEQKEEEVA